MRTTFITILLLISFSVGLAQFDEYFEVDFVNADYYDMCKTKSGKIFLSGYPGIIHYSSDEGETWSKCRTDNNYFLFGLSSYDNLIITVGYAGCIIYSSDDGKNWKKSETITSNILTDVVLIDNKKAIVLGYAGTIIKTEDGCETWRKVESPTSENIKAAIKLNDYIFIANESSKLYKSSDDGDNWHEIKLSESYIKAFNFQVQGDKIFFICNSGIYESSDYGESWKFNEINLKDYNYGNINNNNLLMVGNKSSIKEFENFKEVKRDTSLYSANFPLAYVIINRIIRISDSDILACGNKSFIIKSTDNGKSWNYISYLNDYRDAGFGGIQFLSDSIGFIGGSNEILYKTTDAGTTWKFYQDFENGINYINYIRNIHFSDTAEGFMLSRGGINNIIRIKGNDYKFHKEELNNFKYTEPEMFYQVTGGKYFFYGREYIYNISPRVYYELYDYNKSEWSNWGNIDSFNVRSIYIINNKLYACGEKFDSTLMPNEPNSYYHGAIYSTTDLGLTWERQDFNNVSSISNIEFLSGDSIKLFASLWKSKNSSYTNSYIILSTDDGTSWKTIDSGSTAVYISYPRINDKYLIRTLDSGYVSISADSGENWFKYQIHPNLFFRGIHTTKNTAYILGRLSETYYVVVKIKLKEKYVDIEESEKVEYIPLCWISNPYPNPANNFVNFEIVWAIKYSKEELKISFYNLYGCKVENPNYEIINRTVNSGILRWYSTGLPSGIYFVELNVGGYKRVEKIILY
jgi:photosystem II stability/assembly factor-like uncharacterized protein